MSHEGGGNGDDGDRSDESGQESQPSVDELLRLLAEPERRELVAWLRNTSEECCSFEELTDCLQANLDETPGHEQVQTSLQHVHLPKLAETGVLDYDVRSQTVRYTGHEPLEQLHERVRDFEREYSND